MSSAQQQHKPARFLQHDFLREATSKQHPDQVLVQNLVQSEADIASRGSVLTDTVGIELLLQDSNKARPAGHLWGPPTDLEHHRLSCRAGQAPHKCKGGRC